MWKKWRLQILLFAFLSFQGPSLQAAGFFRALAGCITGCCTQFNEFFLGECISVPTQAIFCCPLSGACAGFFISVPPTQLLTPYIASKAVITTISVAGAAVSLPIFIMSVYIIAEELLSDPTVNVQVREDAQMVRQEVRTLEEILTRDKRNLRHNFAFQFREADIKRLTRILQTINSSDEFKARLATDKSLRHSNINGDELIAYLSSIGVSVTKPSEAQSSCAICIQDYVVHEDITELPCRHLYHTDCVKPWVENRGNCPLCKAQASYYRHEFKYRAPQAESAFPSVPSHQVSAEAESAQPVSGGGTVRELDFYGQDDDQDGANDQSYDTEVYGWGAEDDEEFYRDMPPLVPRIPHSLSDSSDD